MRRTDPGRERPCLRCATDEVGEAIGKIPKGRQRARIRGLHRRRCLAEENPARRVRRGDAWFRTGDLMRQDARGYFYFVDRIGDTFRWKGENVSTTEVAATIMACPGVTEAVVYGVAVPARTVRAGMAALVADGAFDLAVLRLPRRTCRTMRGRCSCASARIATTATFKHQKNELAPEGFDPAATSEDIFFRRSRPQASCLTTPSSTIGLRETSAFKPTPSRRRRRSTPCR